MGIKEIQLVPVGQQVVIHHAPNRDSDTTKPIWTRKPAFADISRYHFLTTAAGQMCTMLQLGADITCDITGGRDSRTVLAIMLFASRLLGIPLNDSIHFNSRENAGIDFQIASQLCNSNDVTLNRPAMEALTKRSLHGDHGYKVWKQQHLSAHHQIMFPIVRRDATHSWLSGNGGESHRHRHSFGPSPDVEHYFRSATKTFPCDKTRDHFLERLLDDLETQRQSAFSESDEFISDAQQVMSKAAADTSNNPRLFGPQISHVLLGAELSQLWR